MVEFACPIPAKAFDRICAPLRMANFQRFPGRTLMCLWADGAGTGIRRRHRG